MGVDERVRPELTADRMTKDEIEDLVDRAFEDAAMPATASELAEPGIEARYVVEHFLGHERHAIDAATFLPTLHMEDFTYMTPAGVAYYLPPVLKLMLREPYSADHWIYLRGFLSSIKQSYARNLKSLRRTQLEAIAAWARFLVDAFDGAWGCDPKEAAKLARLYEELVHAS